MSSTKIYTNTRDDGTKYFSFGSRGEEDSQFIQTLGDDNLTNLLSTQNTNDTNLALAKMQNDWNYNMWQEQNAYNDPSQQLDRYIKAGINPLSASIDGNKAESLQSANMANQTPGQIDPNSDTNKFNAQINAVNSVLQSFKNAFDNQVQIKQLQQQAQALDIQRAQANAGIGLTKEQTKAQSIANSQANQRFTKEMNKMQAETDNLVKQGDLTQVQKDSLLAALPYIGSLEQAKLMKFKAEISSINTHTIGEGFENHVKAMRARLADSGINPDSHGMDKFWDLLVDKPEKIVPLVKSMFDGFIEGAKDPVQEIIDYSEEKLGNMPLPIIGSYNSHYNPTPDYGTHVNGGRRYE